MPFTLIETESAAGVLQALITLGLAALCAYLYRQFRKPYLAWWTVAWGIYLLRIGAILVFLATEAPVWLYWHQVTTGWTAIVLLGAALKFGRPLRWRRQFLPLLLFPPVWSYVAIYRLDNFLLAAGPAIKGGGNGRQRKGRQGAEFANKIGFRDVHDGGAAGPHFARAPSS